MNRSIPSLAIAGALVLGSAFVATPAQAAPGDGTYYSIPASSDLFVVDVADGQSRLGVATYDEWRADGFPAPRPAAVDYVKYTWGDTIYQDVTVEDISFSTLVDYPTWRSLGFPSPRTNQLAADSTVRAYTGSDEALRVGGPRPERQLHRAQAHVRRVRPPRLPECRRRVGARLPQALVEPQHRRAGGPDRPHRRRRLRDVGLLRPADAADREVLRRRPVLQGRGLRGHPLRRHRGAEGREAQLRPVARGRIPRSRTLLIPGRAADRLPALPFSRSPSSPHPVSCSSPSPRKATVNRSIPALALAAALLLGAALPAASAAPASAAPAGTVVYYSNPFDDTLIAVRPGDTSLDPSGATFDEWRTDGFPTPVPATVTYIGYSWESTIWADQTFGRFSSTTMLDFDRWTHAGRPAARDDRLAHQHEIIRYDGSDEALRPRGCLVHRRARLPQAHLPGVRAPRAAARGPRGGDHLPEARMAPRRRRTEGLHGRGRCHRLRRVGLLRPPDAADREVLRRRPVLQDRGLRGHPLRRHRRAEGREAQLRPVARGRVPGTRTLLIPGRAADRLPALPFSPLPPAPPT
ncbi:hypothetical protein [Clavibacter tessellarius]|uniref:hypothetical protein n=1 Tax=Clavibacter tessellarius TaxID=31965 RepID=UPI003248FD37